MLADADVSVPVMVQTPDGSVEDALVAAADDALMVVVGEPQNGRRRDLSARLSQRCKCPVVTVGVGPTPALAS